MLSLSQFCTTAELFDCVSCRYSYDAVKEHLTHDTYNCDIWAEAAENFSMKMTEVSSAHASVFLFQISQSESTLFHNLNFMCICNNSGDLIISSLSCLLVIAQYLLLLFVLTNSAKTYNSKWKWGHFIWVLTDFFTVFMWCEHLCFNFTTWYESLSLIII